MVFRVPIAPVLQQHKMPDCNVYQKLIELLQIVNFFWDKNLKMLNHLKRIFAPICINVQTSEYMSTLFCFRQK